MRIYLTILCILCALDFLFIIFPTTKADKKSNEKLTIYLKENKSWFMTNGSVYPTPGHGKVWPNQLSSDRIVEQLMFIPEKMEYKKKKILSYGFTKWWIEDRSLSYCPVNKCELTSNLEDIENVDAIAFSILSTRSTRFESMDFQTIKNRSKQVWIFYNLESPINTKPKLLMNNVFNWTATYRSDSEIAFPYGKWVYYNPEKRQKKQKKNYAEGKTDQVAMFVSHCQTGNGRLNYAEELGKYINVDIYGGCGSHYCPRKKEKECFKMLKEKYKFYLAFENSNCKEYITEKFYRNALQNNILPIVMGARPEDYKKNAPENSYIHVDDFESPKQLANYLHILDKNDSMYNEYFKWKGTGELINTYFFCRLCALLHDNPEPKIYPNMKEWWSRKDNCT